ncbi:hypothetical protein ACH4OX_36090 [Streptomyces roseolus]|uniref:hypothetical protein n=1 Tax=Streptomyces roseolus TaxID=67358 RepID=UPI003788C93A
MIKNLLRGAAALSLALTSLALPSAVTAAPTVPAVGDMPARVGVVKQMPSADGSRMGHAPFAAPTSYRIRLNNTPMVDTGRGCFEYPSLNNCPLVRLMMAGEDLFDIVCQQPGEQYGRTNWWALGSGAAHAYGFVPIDLLDTPHNQLPGIPRCYG